MPTRNNQHQESKLQQKIDVMMMVVRH